MTLALTPKQTDSFAELINIAFSRAAASLSELTQRRVEVRSPNVKVFPARELDSHLDGYRSGEVATVHQIFTGPLAGDVLLLFDQKSAAMLAGLLTGETDPQGRLDTSLAEALTEVGNILLNACLGMFGNLLEVRVSFSVPRLHLESLTGFLRTMKFGEGSAGEIQYSLLASTSFTVENTDVKGYLVVVMSVTSLDLLVNSLEKLG
jgi:chemotaxis protein CheC